MDFEQYVQARGPALLRVAMVLTGDQHAAEDLAARWPQGDCGPLIDDGEVLDTIPFTVVAQQPITRILPRELPQEGGTMPPDHVR